MDTNKDFQKFSNEDIEIMKEVAKDFFCQNDTKFNKILSEKVVCDLYIALFKSIQINDIFAFYDKYNENLENKLATLYDELISIKKTDFFSKNLLKRIQSKYDYYEKAFKIRTKIQNLQFDYHGLKSSFTNFIRARETLKIEYEFTKSFSTLSDKVKCQGCGIKWLNKQEDNCPLCEKENDINMFLILSNFFHIIGDMETFYKNIPEDTEKTFFDNWEYIRNYFSQRRIKITENFYQEKLKRIGKNQYHKLFKNDKGHAITKSLFNFNAKYNVSLLDNDEELDLREAKNTNVEEFMLDLNKIEFPLCKKIKFGKRIYLSEFKPKMPLLEEIIARDCNIKEINLDEKYFENLKRLYIENNLIKKYDDIKNLKNIKSLRVIDIHDNPIEPTNELWKLVDNMPEIEIRYNWRLHSINRNKIDEESNTEIKKILAEIPPDSESEIVSSLK